MNIQPIHTLRDQLASARLQAIQELAAEGPAVSLEALQKVSLIQTALLAVVDEIEAHEMRVGGIQETPLK